MNLLDVFAHQNPSEHRLVGQQEKRLVGIYGKIPTAAMYIKHCIGFDVDT
jgi:hypothetical protein